MRHPRLLLDLDEHAAHLEQLQFRLDSTGCVTEQTVNDPAHPLVLVVASRDDDFRLRVYVDVHDDGQLVFRVLDSGNTQPLAQVRDLDLAVQRLHAHGARFRGGQAWRR